jgi:non-haem Fe2+, alpha-ketoglutarate-dependent halogenase
MTKILNKNQKLYFEENGFLFPVKIMSKNKALMYREKLEKFEKSKGNAISGNDRHKAHLLFKWVNEIVNNKTILDAIEDILGPNILCWSSNFFIKEANDNTFVSWHQDSRYWGLEPDNVITAWLALSDANIKTGPMEVIPKSHKWNNLDHKETFNKNNLLSRGQELDINLSNYDSVVMPLNAGEISLHHVKLAHSSKINITQDRRIGIAIRYTTPEVRQTKVIDTKDSALLVRGEDKYMNFIHEVSPKFDLDSDAIENHKIISEAHSKILMS